MNWQELRQAACGRSVSKYDETEVAVYDEVLGLGRLTPELDAACLSDLRQVFQFQHGMKVLDVGAGTGALCELLARFPGLSITALEPSPAMLAKLRCKPELSQVATVLGFCDGNDDRHLFDAAQFQVIVSRKVVNGLFDPLTAFRNWHHWLSPGGSVVVIDGLFGRDSWTGVWQEEIDILPLSACQTMALTPYLLEEVGFRIEAVALMEATNAISRTPHYVIVATKQL